MKDKRKMGAKRKKEESQEERTQKTEPFQVQGEQVFIKEESADGASPKRKNDV